MCYAIPGRVEKVSDNIAFIDYFGEKRKALIDIEAITVGDFVYAQGGVIVQKIIKEEAISILSEWQDLFFRLKDRDHELAQGKSNISNVDTGIFRIIEKVEDAVPLSRNELLSLLGCKKEEDLTLIYKTANKVRQKHLKNSCCIHGIIEFSNICKNDCAYCGIRVKNDRVARYRMEIDEIVERADFVVNELGFKALVLQSGEDDYYTTEKLVDLVRKIRKRCGVLIFLSIGERGDECYNELYRAGARGILLRFETSNRDIYQGIHTTLSYQDRLNALKEVGDIGYMIATGALIGLSGQRENDLLDDIILAHSLSAEMYSFGPLIPHPHTPLDATPTVDIDTVLKVIAVTRFIDPEGKILVTTAMETLFGKEGRRRGMMAGANSLMINLTPLRYKRLYSIYPEKGYGDKEIHQEIEEILFFLYSLGRAPTDIGMGKRYG